MFKSGFTPNLANNRIIERPSTPRVIEFAKTLVARLSARPLNRRRRAPRLAFAYRFPLAL
jgi:hypothetical protein